MRRWAGKQRGGAPGWPRRAQRETIPIDRQTNEPNPYELAPDGLPAATPEGYVVRRDADELIDALASDLYIHAHNCVRTFGDFHVALSGGRTPQPLYRRLMYDPRFRDLPWPRTHLWVTSGTSAGEPVGPQIIETIALHADVPPSQTHAFAETPGDYAAELREHLGWREKGHDRLDFVLLGIDARGGLAGLRGSDLGSTEPATAGDGGPTLSLGMINASRFVAVMALGGSKRPALADPSGLVAKVRPLSGELRFYTDTDACPPAPGGDS